MKKRCLNAAKKLRYLVRNRISGRNINIATFAKKHHISDSGLAHAFHSLTGNSLHRYIELCLVDRGLALMRHGYSIKQLVKALRLKNSRVLAHAFHTICHHPPSTYVKAMKKI